MNNACIVNRYLYSASQGISQTEALSVHFSSMTKLRLRRERDEETGETKKQEEKE